MDLKYRPRKNDIVRLKRLPGSHQHLTGKTGVVLDVSEDGLSVEVQLAGRRDALLVHAAQVQFTGRTAEEE